MRRLIAVILVSALLVGFAVPAAHAGNTATNVALGLASFAVFSQFARPFFHPRPVHAYDRPVYVYQSPTPVIYPPPYPVVVVPPPPPPTPTVVYYPHGRHELRGDGVTTAYHWVWIPNPPPPPAVPPPPPVPPAGS